MPNPVRSLGYKCYSSNSFRPVKSPSNSTRYNCQKISEKRNKKGHIFLGDQHNPDIYKFFKNLTNHRMKTNRAVVFSCWHFPNIHTGTTDETFQQTGKQDSYRHILKSSAFLYESLGSQFFRTTTGIQSRPDAFDKSR